MSKKVKKVGKIGIILGIIFSLVALYFGIPATKAATITSRNVNISDSRTSATGVTYDFAGTTSASNTKCIQMQFCTTGSGTCTTPTGLSTTSATKVTSGWNVFNQASWTIANPSNGTIQLTYSTGENGGTNSSWVVGNITNPSSAGSYYVRINTYSNADCTGDLDSGVVMFAVLSGISVTASIGETLSFSASDYAIGLGTWTGTEVRWATADEQGATSEQGNGYPTQLTLSTNASGGTTITIHDVGNGSGSAGLYNGSNLIPAAAANSITGGTAGYAVYGKNASSLTIATGFNGGSSTGVLSTSAQTFATAGGAVSSATVDVQPKAAISSTTQPGSYSDTLIFIATPTY